MRGAGPRRQGGWSRLGGCLAVTLLLAACGSTTPTAVPSASPASSTPASPTPAASAPGSPSAGPSQDPAAVFAAIQRQVEAIRGLEPKQPVQPTLLDEAGLRQLIARQFAKDNPADLVGAEERLLKHLGLLPASASLSSLEQEFQGGEVAGLYSPEDKRLYVVSKSGGLGPTERVTYAHEFTHQLQDQSFGLSGIGLDQPDQGDRALARLALVEGDATLVMQAWEQANLTAAELGQIANLGDVLGQLALLGRMPPVLVQTSLFPYTAGAQFVAALQASGGWAAVDAAFQHRLPGSTSEILHPDLYLSGWQPRQVGLPADILTRLGSGWTLTMADTLGELQLRIWLATGGGAGLDTSAGGWNGDRIALYEGPNGTWAVALVTAWTDGTAADRFATAAQSAAAKLLVARVLGGAGGPVVLVASDQATLGALATASFQAGAR